MFGISIGIFKKTFVLVGVVAMMTGCGFMGSCVENYSIHGSPVEMALSYVDVETGGQMDIPANREYFSGYFEGEAAVVNAVMLSYDGSREVVGTLASDAGISFEDTMFLKGLLVNYVQTFDHLGSELCLVDLVNDEDRYVARFEASHEYCTNDCYTDEYAFAVEVDKESGVVSVVGE